MPATEKKSPYRGDRRKTTLVISGALVDLAQEYFTEESEGSLSRWVEKALKAKFRKDAHKLRKRRLTIPETVFAK